MKGVARVLLPIVTVLAVNAVHFALTTAPAPAVSASPWAALPPPSTAGRFDAYLANGGLWLGYCYGVAAAMALMAVVFFANRRARSGQGAFFGGITLSGVLAGSACFMTGCCGSPMLAVWVGLLGAAAAPWLGPFAALVSTVTAVVAVRRMV